MALNLEKLESNYLKRWSSLNVKILSIQDCINTTTSEITALYLEDYKSELETIKRDEKNLLIKTLQ